jgi:phytol kinase
MNAVTGYLLCYGYVGFVIVISILARKLRIVGEEGARKLIHVLLCATWVFGILFSNRIHSVIIPITFIIINFLITRFQIVPGVYREKDDSYGSVFYVVSLALMNLAIIYDEKFLVPAGIGAFCLAFGDGFAAIFGGIQTKYNIKLKKNRSLFGSLGCFVFSFIGIWLVCNIIHADVPIPWMLVFAMISTIMEFIGGRFDNLTIPLGVFVLASIVMSI